MTRAPKVPCSVQRCKYPPRHLGLCKKHAVQRADTLFGGLIRSRGFCQSGRPTHKGVLQCAHGFSRSYKATRWSENQCWCLCAGCHLFYTERPLEWDAWMQERMGDSLYWEVRHLALSHVMPDLDEVITELEDITERMA